MLYDENEKVLTEQQWFKKYTPAKWNPSTRCTCDEMDRQALHWCELSSNLELVNKYNCTMS